MLRLAFHLLLIAGLLLNAVAPASAHAHGAGGGDVAPDATANVARSEHRHAHHAAPSGVDVPSNAGHHAHHAGHHDAQELLRDHDGKRAQDAHPAAHASSSHDACGGAGCACGCVLPPAMALPMSTSPTARRAAPLLTFSPVPALAAPTTPPFRPPATITWSIA